MMTKLQRFLGTEIDNSALILFRMFYGFLIFAESTGAILTGWVDQTFIKPQFTFSFIGFEWLQPLPAAGMYAWFVLMAMVGICIMLGFYYKVFSLLYFFLWSGIYFMQKTHYNNHHYLMVFLSFIMFLMPAHKYASLDVRHGRTDVSSTCPRICIGFFILQVGLVYIVASLNKLHIDWLMARPLQVWFEAKADYPVFGPLLRQDWFPYFIAWTGVIYDGLIVFLLLHPKTRKLGFALSLLFNLFNSAVFQIGVFPYLMIAFTVFFFPGERLRTLFFKNKPQVVPIRRSLSNVVLVPFLLFLLIQVLLPLRHHLFEGDVHWTEEGHRLSWQMMLRAKRSTTGYYVEDKQTGERERVKLLDYMTPDQRWDFGNKPDMIWQFAQRLKHVYAEKGKDVAVYAHIKVSLNGSKFAHLIDPDVDLASVPWERFSHSDWILDENRPKK